ncbi:thioredoxin family protein [Hydrogenophaga sp. BPS33]|uniref:thioredoxin family protein n=1 Tax=Hydrogenophaga sp. BPS33 TaxID=2651974 RepID=UPI00131F799B|nr:thioredoxin family protein [Hydrogenophaga sp. BPS33]QHE85842.1 thioredoxin family protein [Hydrogenophaga sp. BPS33]
MQVVCLCAEWCGTCRDWRPVIDALARAHPQVRWRWLDIEDEADLLGDLDVETLPTLLVGRGDRVLFFGSVLPKAELVKRLVESLATQEHAAAVDGDVAALWQRLR